MPSFLSHAGASASDRNLFLLFRHRFDLTTPSPSVLHIFADTRYRLSVNGTIVAYGPTRFYPDFPEYDSHDLTSHLKSGANEIRVEVNSRNASSYQAVPSQPGLWVQGDAGATDLSSPGAWQVKISHARSSEAPPFSFAQGPVEILDAAQLESEWASESDWQTPIEVSGWGEPRPRSVPPTPFPVRGGAQLLLQAPLKNEEERLIFHRAFPPSEAGPTDRSRYFAVALNLFSPHEQDVNLGLFWGDNFLNGERLSLTNDALRGNRQNVTAHLQAGWNLIYAQIQILQPTWGFTIAWPRASHLQASPEGLRVSEAMSLEALEQLRGPLPTTTDDLANAPYLQPIDQELHRSFPAREVAWDLPEAPQSQPRNQIVSETGGAGVALWDFEREFLGHLRLHVQSEKGAVLDVAADEVRRADGLVALYASNPFVNSVERFIVPPGDSIIESFHPRGGRFLQVTARSQGAVQVTNVEERSALLLLPPEGRFECSDPLLNSIWRTGAATVEACLPDVWVDCPWREQGAYLGDTLVQFHATRALSSHLEIARRALRLWSQGQRADGLTPACVPAWYDSPHGDFSLIYVLLLRDFWAQSNDAALVRELWPTVQKIFASPLWQSDETGLWTATPDLRLFLDWGIPQNERLGAANGALNAFRVGALQAASELAEVIGEDPTPWKNEAQEVTAAFRRVLWRPQRADFAPFAGEDNAPAHHTNALALRFGLASNEQEPGVLQNLRTAHALIKNVEQLRPNDGHLELYFTHFALQALVTRGLHDEAASWVRDAWSPMIEAKAVTFWETLHRGLHSTGSLCHAWSCAPTWFLAREVLGVHPVEGNPNAFQIRPNPIGLQWARGTYPHPRGPIEVSWRHENGHLTIETHAPKGVELQKQL